MPEHTLPAVDHEAPDHDRAYCMTCDNRPTGPEAEDLTAYARAVADWDRLRDERRAENLRHERETERLTTGLREAERVIYLAENQSPDLAEAYTIARDLLRIDWSRPRGDLATRRATPEVGTCFRDAIEDLRLGPVRLRRGYLGVKAYDRWNSQRTDCDYGMGPSHGHIWFRIGLRDPGRPLDETERLGCIKWLQAVQADPELLP